MNLFKTNPCQSINANGKLITFEKPLIMGILNITPDSFFDGGKYNTIGAALAKAKEMVAEKVDIIDIGAYSSRPGASPITTQEEIDRSLPIIERIRSEHPEIMLSIDTFRSEVAEQAVRAGANIINDISGGSLDENMYGTVAKLSVPYILMHMRGNPEKMQSLTCYKDVVNDICTYFGNKISELRSIGVKDIILDPGFGFSKTIDQNYELLKRVDEFHYFGLPILGGISRKSMIYNKLKINPQESLNSTTALNTLLIERGVHILRVHDVKEAKELTDLLF